jgi:flavin-dependent dehydrogenase
LTGAAFSAPSPGEQAAASGQGGRAMELVDGSRVGIIGGGPAGSFFSFFLLRMAESIGLQLVVEVLEPRFFRHRGPAGCNHCGGIISESLVQMLAAEGINLPPSVVRQGIDSYVLHTDQGDVRIRAPRDEKRIAAVYRGNGPRESEPTAIAGFDRFLLDLVTASGATVLRTMATDIAWRDGRPRVTCADGTTKDYDLLVMAAGVNSQAVERFRDAATTFSRPKTQQTFISEFRLGGETVQEWFGDSMHVFLLDIRRLTFAAIIPKGEFVTLCLLGDDLDAPLIQEFLDSLEVTRCFPEAVVPRLACHCFPHINVAGAVRPYGDRIVYVGDCGVARLYKDGIGSAYRTAKAAAKTALFHGISADDFQTHYWPACRSLTVDNAIAKVVFAVTHVIQRSRILRRGVLRMTAREQANGGRHRMSNVLWDTFTGSAPYRDILLRTMHPMFPVLLAWNVIAGNLTFRREHPAKDTVHGR